jgi:hypothetical protein
VSDVFKSEPMIVLLYKEALLNTNELDPVMPSSVVSLLQEFEDVFPTRCRMVCLQLGG